MIITEGKYSKIILEGNLILKWLGGYVIEDRFLPPPLPSPPAALLFPPSPPLSPPPSLTTPQSSPHHHQRHQPEVQVYGAKKNNGTNSFEYKFYYMSLKFWNTNLYYFFYFYLSISTLSMYQLLFVVRSMLHQKHLCIWATETKSEIQKIDVFMRHPV